MSDPIPPLDPAILASIAGAALFRTESTRPWPYAPSGFIGDDLGLDLIMAPPGRGKTVFLNVACAALPDAALGVPSDRPIPGGKP